MRTISLDDNSNGCPYSQGEGLRPKEPIWDPALKVWMVSRYDDVQRVLSDEAFEVVQVGRAVAHFADRAGTNYDALVKALEAMLFYRTGEHHFQYRQLISRVLTRVPFHQLGTMINECAGLLMTELTPLSEFDAVRDYANVLPALVMTRILGLPSSDARYLVAIGQDFTRVFDVVRPSVYKQLNVQATAALDHLSLRICHNLRQEDDNGLNMLYRGSCLEGDAKIREAASLALFAFFVGTETTSALISSSIDALLGNPRLYAEARTNPSLAERIITQTIRLESPVQRVVRIATARRIIGGRLIQPGDRIVLLLGAANSEAVEDISFGAGKHYCLGAALAKLEARIALQHLLCMPALEPRRDQRSWFAGKAIRKLTRLPVRKAEN